VTSREGEFVRHLEEDSRSLADEAPGFVSSRLIDLGTGTILWLTTFEDEQAAKRATARIDAEIEPRLDGYLAQPPEVTVGRVHNRYPSTTTIARMAVATPAVTRAAQSSRRLSRELFGSALAARYAF
jgi:hypothetical protein